MFGRLLRPHPRVLGVSVCASELSTHPNFGKQSTFDTYKEKVITLLEHQRAKFDGVKTVAERTQKKQWSNREPQPYT